MSVQLGEVHVELHTVPYDPAIHPLAAWHASVAYHLIELRGADADIIGRLLTIEAARGPWDGVMPGHVGPSPRLALRLARRAAAKPW